jgi:hypothetical protein
MQRRFWRNQYLGVLAGLAILSLSSASLQAQDTSSMGRARMDTSQTDSIGNLDSTLYDSTRVDSGKMRSAGSDSLNQNPPGYRGMEQDSSGASGDTSSATGYNSSAGRTTSAANDSTWRDSAGLNRDKPSVTEVSPSAGSAASDSTKMGP